MTMLQSHATTVAELLGESRRVAGLTTRGIAPLIGVAPATVSKWERGQGEPSATQFVLWARATKQPLDQMIEGLVKCAPWDSNPEPIDYGFIRRTLRTVRVRLWVAFYATRVTR